MDDKECAKSMNGKLFCVFRCFGRAFPVYYQYSDEDGLAIPGYPNFRKNPQYTGDGRPFVLATLEGCEYGASQTPDKKFNDGCGGCRYFRQELDGVYSLFGICMNERRQLPQTERKETE